MRLKDDAFETKGSEVQKLPDSNLSEAMSWDELFTLIPDVVPRDPSFSTNQLGSLSPANSKHGPVLCDLLQGSMAGVNTM